jgi:hypothetical protein
MSLTIGLNTYTITIPTKAYNPGTNLLATIPALFAATAMGLTTYVLEMLWDTQSYLVTVNVRDTSILPPNFVPYSLVSTLVTPGDTPNVLQLLGFATNPLVSLVGTETSYGPLNSNSDRYAVISCDEARGMNGAIYSVDSKPTPTLAIGKDWHNGMIALVPLTGDPGDIIEYFPEDKAPWSTLPKGSTNGTLTFRLGRDRYRYFGPTQISWSMELEVQ